MPAPALAQVRSGAGRLSVAVWGDAGQPTVLMQHGMRDHGRSWDWSVEALLGKCRVIAPDLRGHGNSDAAGSYTIADYVRDMAVVADALAPERFLLVGHSLGGVIALRYASAFPERVTALCGIECVELPIVRDQRVSPKPYPARLRQWIETQREAPRQPRRYASAAQAEARMAQDHADLDPATIAHLTHHALIREPDGSLRWKYDNAARVRAPDDADGHDLDQALSAVACPVTLLYGDSGWIPVPPADRLKRLADHRLIRFAGAGHWLHHAQRARFLDVLQSFVSQHTKDLCHA